jgi:hypothetical protein
LFLYRFFRCEVHFSLLVFHTIRQFRSLQFYNCVSLPKNFLLHC